MGAELAIDAAREVPQGRHVVVAVVQKLKERDGHTLKWYCEKKGLSYSSLRVGFISKKAANQLEMDGLL
jgi:hypothetical protein